MSRAYQNLTDQYNNWLHEHHQSLRLIGWLKGEIILSTGVTLTGAEIKRFRERVKSPTLCTHIDEIYSIALTEVRDVVVNNIKRLHASRTNKQHWENLPEDIKQHKIKHMQQIQSMVDQSNINRPVPWNKGKTKHTDSRLATSSIKKSGEGNPMYGHRWSSEYKQHKSNLIKDRIHRGLWTPCVHNSRTHFDCVYKGQRYRSSWEAMYAALNPTAEFERVRISYTHDNQQRIYIIDFVDDNTKQLIEIKPQAHQASDKFRAKVAAATEYANSIGYEFVVVDEQYFVDNYTNIPFNELHIPNIREKVARIKSEADKQNTD